MNLLSVLSKRLGETKLRNSRGILFDIQHFSLHDGPGIRTVVFLKGCPLKCSWCANPESINPEPEIGFLRFRCNKCNDLYKCMAVCPEAAITLDNESIPRIDRGRCTICGECAKVCFTKALILYGKEVASSEVFFKEILPDKIFYDGSGGGVTVSGGEPLRQPSFVKALFKLCSEHDIPTAIETSGFASPRVLKEILTLTHYVLFDLKFADSTVHYRFTGQPNALILQNARLVARSGIPTLFRFPLIPGITDGEENIRQIASLVREIHLEKTVEIMPYHRFGLPKYRALEKPFPLEELKPPESDHIRSTQRIFEEDGNGLRCLVSR